MKNAQCSTCATMAKSSRTQVVGGHGELLDPHLLQEGRAGETAEWADQLLAGQELTDLVADGLAVGFERVSAQSGMFRTLGTPGTIS